MANWHVRDRYGHEIYLTQERWNHIINSHPELDGRREQDAILSDKYTYIRRYDEVSGFNSIVVKVLFRTKAEASGKRQPNNYIVTAWLTYMPSLLRWR